MTVHLVLMKPYRLACRQDDRLSHSEGCSVIVAEVDCSDCLALIKKWKENTIDSPLQPNGLRVRSQ